MELLGNFGDDLGRFQFANESRLPHVHRLCGETAACEQQDSRATERLSWL